MSAATTWSIFIRFLSIYRKQQEDLTAEAWQLPDKEEDMIWLWQRVHPPWMVHENGSLEEGGAYLAG